MHLEGRQHFSVAGIEKRGRAPRQSHLEFRRVLCHYLVFEEVIDDFGGLRQAERALAASDCVRTEKLARSKEAVSSIAVNVDSGEAGDAAEYRSREVGRW